MGTFMSNVTGTLIGTVALVDNFLIDADTMMNLTGLTALKQLQLVRIEVDAVPILTGTGFAPAQVQLFLGQGVWGPDAAHGLATQMSTVNPTRLIYRPYLPGHFGAVLSNAATERLRVSFANLAVGQTVAILVKSYWNILPDQID
jgi:hypothetical protein